jgi:hypothetical protein
MPFPTPPFLLHPPHPRAHTHAHRSSTMQVQGEQDYTLSNPPTAICCTPSTLNGLSTRAAALVVTGRTAAVCHGPCIVAATRAGRTAAANNFDRKLIPTQSGICGGRLVGRKNGFFVLERRGEVRNVACMQWGGHSVAMCVRACVRCHSVRVRGARPQCWCVL